MTLLEILPFVVLGGVLGLDVVSFPQAMLSRPIVAATVAGAFAGSAVLGLLLGAIVELFALEMLAVGASRYPEWGSASVVGGVLIGAGAAVHPLAPTLAASIVATLVVAWLGGWSMYGLRKLNGIVARRAIPALERGDGSAVARVQLLGLTSDFARAALLTGLGVLVFLPLVPRVAQSEAVPDVVYTVAVWGLALAAAVSALWRIIRGTVAADWWLIGGLAAGALIVGMR
jgi:PTS system mannose-specific IIC component